MTGLTRLEQTPTAAGSILLSVSRASDHRKVVVHVYNAKPSSSFRRRFWVQCLPVSMEVLAIAQESVQEFVKDPNESDFSTESPETAKSKDLDSSGKIRDHGVRICNGFRDGGNPVATNNKCVKQAKRAHVVPRCHLDVHSPKDGADPGEIR